MRLFITLLAVVGSALAYLVLLGAIAVVGSLVITKFRPKRPPSDGSEARRIHGRMRRMARQTLLLIPAKQPGFSKLGGDPELPADLEWPVGDRAPRTFVAQIDLEAFRPHGELDWLPETGRFYAFYDPERHGFADVVTVLYSDATPGPPRPPASAPSWRFGERRVGFMSFTSIPSLDWLDVDVREINVSDAELDDLAAAPDAPFGDDLQHRIGGYPSEIQEECMPLSCEYLARGLPSQVSKQELSPAILRASREWRLLLQIDSDPALKMNFGDGGRLYVFIRERHARAGDFSRTVSLWQTY